MADNGTADSGPTIAWDDIGGVAYQRVKLTFGTDGSSTDVSSSNPLPVTNASLPLPSGASTAANQSTIIGHVDGIETLLGGTLAVSAASLPLPSGAATSANQTTIIGHVDGIESLLAGTLTVGGTVTANAGSGTFAISAASLPLPSGAATSAKQDTLAALFPSSIGQKEKTGSLSVTLASDDDLLTANAEYETVAASATDQALGATGAAGDFLSHLIVVPATTSPGAVSIKDGAGSAITVFTGGSGSVLSLVPFTVVLNMKSTGGAWKVTTGSNVSAIGVGNFT